MDPSSMRLLVISRCSNSFSSSRGGADVVALSTATLLSRRGINTWYVGEGTSQSYNLHIVPLSGRGMGVRSRGNPRVDALRYLVSELRNVIRATFRGAQTLDQVLPNVVLSNHSISTIVLRIWSPKVPIVYRMHDGIHAQRFSKGFLEWTARFLMSEVLERLATKVATHIVTPNGRVTAELLTLGRSPSRITTLYPLLAPTTRSSSQSSLEHIAESSEDFAVPRDQFVLSVGQQTGRKRFDLLIRAVSGSTEPIRLVLVGDGPLHRHYEQLAINERVRDRVTFLTNVPDALLDSLYHSCSLFALVSENEGFPVTVVEALSHGCPTYFACPNSPNDFSDSGPAIRIESTLPSDREIAAVFDEYARMSGPRRKELRASALALAESVFPDPARLTETFLSILERI